MLDLSVTLEAFGPQTCCQMESFSTLTMQYSIYSICTVVHVAYLYTEDS